VLTNPLTKQEMGYLSSWSKCSMFGNAFFGGHYVLSSHGSRIAGKERHEL